MPKLSPLPCYGVADSGPKEFRGRNHPDDPTPFLRWATWEQAFTQHWDGDAHCVLYHVVDANGRVVVNEEGQVDLPRLNKPIVPHLEAAGLRVVQHTVMLDLDRPGHAEWPRGRTDLLRERAAFEDSLEAALMAEPALLDVTHLYYTKHGARLVYVLDVPISVAQAERKTRWMIHVLRKHGVHVDELCDWNRMFRLPRVIRHPLDPIFSQDDWYFGEILNKKSRLRTAEVGEMGRDAKAPTPAKPVDLPKPTAEEARLTLTFYNHETERFNQTPFYKLARAVLKGRDCYDCIFGDAPIAPEGERNQTIVRYVGQAINLLIRREGVTPVHIYGLLFSAVNALEPDQDTPDWTDVLWDVVCRLWAVEIAKVEEERIQEAKEKAQASDMLASVLAGMREWLDVPSSDDDAALAFARRRFIVSHGRTYYLIGPDGRYRSQPYLLEQLIPAIREHCPGLIETRVPKGDTGLLKDITTNELLNHYSTAVAAVRLEPGGEKDTEKGFIENPGAEDAELVLCAYRRNPRLIPRYDPEVDAWLQALFGEEFYDDGLQWLAWALAFDEGPICALSIEGDQGIGKKMLARGLAETLSRPRVATDEDLTGQYQYGLIDTPFLVVNEGWSTMRGGKHPADRFRELVGGDGVTINRKFMSPVTIKSPVRILFTANNLDVVKTIAQHRDLSEMDRNALAIRLRHMSVGDGGGRWLRAMGGHNLTSRRGHRWIAPDAGGASDYVVARHFLWLYERRHQWPKGDRLLVEGSGSDELLHELQTGVGSAPLVIECIAKMVEQAGAGKSSHFIVEDGELYTFSSGVLDFFRTNLSGNGDRLTVNAVTHVLQGLGTPANRTMKTRPGMGSKRWVRLSLRKIVKAVRQTGWSAGKLEELYRKACEEGREDWLEGDGEPLRIEPAGEADESVGTGTREAAA